MTDVTTKPKNSELTFTPEEKERMKAQFDKYFNRYKLETTLNAEGKQENKIDLSDSKHVFTMMRAFGTIDPDVITTQINYLYNAIRLDEGDKRSNAIIGMLYALEPRNELEGMLAAQIVATNHVAMRMLSQSLDSQSLEAANHYTNRAHKAQSLLLRQMELLNTLRNGGQTTQKVVVERVEVKAGGQAIVGNVTGGGGVKGKRED